MVNTLREIEKNKDGADEDSLRRIAWYKTSIPDTITPNTDCTVPLPLIQQLAYGSFLYFYLLFVVAVTVDIVGVPFIFIICIFHLSALGITGKSKQCKRSQIPDQQGLRWTVIDGMVVQYTKARIQQQQQQP